MDNFPIFPDPSPVQNGASALFRRRELDAVFVSLESELKRSREMGREQRRIASPEFTVFDFINPTENFLSDLLRFFLDPEASHGQGTLFVNALIGVVRPGFEVTPDEVSVVRETLTFSLPAAQSRRRMDLLITTNRFLLGIENKKYSGEGHNQIHDYSVHLSNIAAHRDFCLLFLTRFGAEALSIAREAAGPLKERRRLINWSWERDVPTWLRACREECRSEKVRHFMDDFLKYIRTYLAQAATE